MLSIWIFKKAFDSVPHKRLFSKLQAYGLAGHVLNWVNDFLTNRKQRVVVNDVCSEFRNVLSGVPQGSVIGPLLFILYINDLPLVLQTTCKIFADDTKIYSITDNIHALQDDLYSLFDWSEKWKMNFNISKCKIMHIGKNNPLHVYYVDRDNTVMLSVCNSEKDVGVIFDNGLRFDLHINESINRANRLLGMIYRSFTYLDTFIFITLYKMLIRSVLEYGNCIWSPLYKRQSIAIEKVQRRATRLLPTAQLMSYEERLRYLKLPSLKYRRKRGDLIQNCSRNRQY